MRVFLGGGRIPPRKDFGGERGETAKQTKLGTTSKKVGQGKKKARRGREISRRTSPQEGNRSSGGSC